MGQREDVVEGKPGIKPTRDELAKKTYAIYVKGGRQQGHHAHMAADFRMRFWISIALTLPILGLSPMLQSLVGLRDAVRFSGDLYVLFGFLSAVFWYGVWPFLKGLYTELSAIKPGMLTLVAVAYSKKASP